MALLGLGGESPPKSIHEPGANTMPVRPWADEQAKHVLRDFWSRKLSSYRIRSPGALPPSLATLVGPSNTCFRRALYRSRANPPRAVGETYGKSCRASGMMCHERDNDVVVTQVSQNWESLREGGIGVARPNAM